MQRLSGARSHKERATPPQSSDEQPFVTLDFQLAYGPLEADETVHVVGSLPSLGCWNPDYSIPMRQQAFATWTTERAVSVVAGCQLEYKYLLFRGGTLVRWERFDGNRFVRPVGPVCKLQAPRSRTSKTATRAPCCSSGCSSCPTHVLSQLASVPSRVCVRSSS